MSDDLEIIEEDPEPDTCHSYYIDRIDLPELRRYICLDMARMSGSLPDKMVKLATDMEKFLQGKALRAISD